MLHRAPLNKCGLNRDLRLWKSRLQRCPLRISAMSARRVPVKWPSGLLQNVAFVAMTASTAVAFYPASRTLPILCNLFEAGVSVFRGVQGLQTVMGCALLTHVLESLFTINICRKAGLASVDTFGWWLLTMLMGYPAIMYLKERLQEDKGKLS